MSGTNVNNEFVDFGKRIKTIAILTLISFILGIIGAFILIASIAAIVLSLVIIIFFLLVLGNTKRAGKILNNNKLLEFKPRFLWGTIIRFIGQILWIVYFWVDSLLLILIGVVLIIVGSIIRYKAWSGLATFFKESQLFPPYVSGKANTGAKLCKIATILDMTIILSFIGEILRIIGYFKLAVLKSLIGAPAQPTYQPAAPQTFAAPAPAPSAGTSFCPNCGSSISSGTRFCPECGSETT